MDITNGVNLSPPVEESYSEMILATPTPYNTHIAASQRIIHRRESGTVGRRRRYNSLGTSKVPDGQNGIERPAKLLTAVDVDYRIKFYSDAIIINEQVQLTSQSDPLINGTKRLAVSLRQTEDELTRDMLLSTAAAVNCVHGSNGDVPTNITAKDVLEVCVALRRADGMFFFDGITGENRFGTGPIKNCFIAMGHSDLETEFNELPYRYKDIMDYPNPDKALVGEVGAIHNMRMLLSSIGSISEQASAKGADVYNLFCTAQEGYSTIYQEGYKPHMIYRPPIFSGPRAENASLAWKTVFAGNLNNESWVTNLRSTASV